MNPETEKEFEAVYRENAPLVYRYLLSIGCPPQDAEDITQETFVKALLNIDRYRGECKLSVWLNQIAKNTWITHLKKQKRITDSDLPESGFEDSHICEWIDVIENLSEPYRTVLIKKLLGDLSYSEIAAVFGKSESWARVTFYRGKVMIQKTLREGSK